jgi:hypothetical protein
LANYRTLDRSVKGNALTKTEAVLGNITQTLVATDAELMAYGGFSASDYLSQAYDADFDFGTGDFSIMVWAKWTATATTTQAMVDRGAASGTGVRFYLYDVSSGGKPKLQVSDGTTAVDIEAATAYNDGNWHQIVAVRRSSSLAIYVDGKDAQTTHVTNSYDLDNSSASLNVGTTYLASLPLNGSLSLLRISATAPTPQQIKEIYEAEKPLFAANAKCLLQSTHSTYNNTVWDLSHDKSTGLLAVAQADDTTANNVGVNFFRGLEMVNTFAGSDHGWTHASAVRVATAGGVMAADRGTTVTTGGVLVDLPSIDVRAELNEGESKIPDDGKFHFEGITTSNGGDVIAHIPIAEEENVTVNAHVTAKGYGADLGTHYANYILTEQFYRAAGGDVTSAVAETSIVSQESAAGLDATLGVDTSADTAKITVTGDASDRVVWTASVEVIRDAEKSYER